jgi:hypothetical protein
MQQYVVVLVVSRNTLPVEPPPVAAHDPFHAECDGVYLNDTLPFAFWPSVHGVLASSVDAAVPVQFVEVNPSTNPSDGQPGGAQAQLAAQPRVSTTESATTICVVYRPAGHVWVPAW